MRPLASKNAFGEVNKRLNAFIIGQIKVCLALAVLYTMGLLIIGINFSIPIGILSGLMFVIPYVGTVFGILLYQYTRSNQFWCRLAHLGCLCCLRNSSNY